MMPFSRGPAPRMLLKYAEEINRDFAAKRELNPSHSFGWPNREGRNLGDVVRETLADLTGYHCTYCDGFPLGATGLGEIDHFRPKRIPAFHHLVAEWTNLFIACSVCNRAKGEKWDEAILKADEPGYSFERFFEYRTHSGELHANPAAEPGDQLRARRTIEILDLNRSGACKSRKRAVERIGKVSASEELQDQDYRFLIPIVRTDSWD